MADCLLIDPPFFHIRIKPHSERFTIPRGLLSISSMLEKEGYSCEIIPMDELYINRKDFSFPYKTLKKKLKK